MGDFPKEVGIISSIITQDGKIYVFGNTFEIGGWKKRLVKFEGSEFKIYWKFNYNSFIKVLSLKLSTFDKLSISKYSNLRILIGNWRLLFFYISSFNYWFIES